MIRTFMRGAIGALALALAACGGGTDTCNPVTGGNVCDGRNETSVQVASITLTLSKSTVQNTGEDSVAVTAIAKNALNQTISGVPLLISADSGAEVTVSGETTNSSGELRATVGIGELRNNRTIIVRAIAPSSGVIAEKSILVSGAELTGTPVPRTIEPGGDGLVTFRLVDAADNVMSGSAIVVTGADGAETAGVTDASGEYAYRYRAPTAAGETTIRAVAGGANASVNVLVQSVGGGGVPVVDPATSPVRSASLSANPSVVNVNLQGSTANVAQLRALFVTDNNQPIENIRVRFEIADTNSPGGSISTGSTLVYSSAGGVATSTYIAGSTQSPTDGVTIRACWSYTDTVTCTPDQTVTTTLTVVADPVSVSIGTNQEIQIGTSGLTYVKRYVVQVVDSSGVAKPGVTISPSVDLTQYYKGRWVIAGEAWAQLLSTDGTCDNEDLNRNNVYEVYSDGWDEDVNGSLNLTAGRPALEPRKADVAISFEGGAQTNASGIVVLRVEYPQDIASWVRFNLQVAASGISGTEGRANYNGVLPVPANVVNNTEASPPFELSPYGLQPGDTTTKIFEGKTYTLCTNPN